MKLQNIILSGACKYEKSVKGMEERRTNIKPLTKPPGYKNTKLDNFIVDSKQFQAIVTTFDFKRNNNYGRSDHTRPLGGIPEKAKSLV